MNFPLIPEALAASVPNLYNSRNITYMCTNFVKMYLYAISL